MIHIFNKSLNYSNRPSLKLRSTCFNTKRLVEPTTCHSNCTQHSTIHAVVTSSCHPNSSSNFTSNSYANYMQLSPPPVIRTHHPTSPPIPTPTTSPVEPTSSTRLHLIPPKSSHVMIDEHGRLLETEPLGILGTFDDNTLGTRGTRCSPPTASLL